MEEVSIGVLKFKFWHWSFVLNDFFSNWILLNECWIFINQCMSKWLLLRVATHVNMRNKICYHPLKLHLQKQRLGDVLWKKYSSLPRLHVVGISWSVWEDFNSAPNFVNMLPLAIELLFFSQLRLYCPEHLKLLRKSTPQNTFFTEQIDSLQPFLG